MQRLVWTIVLIIFFGHLGFRIANYWGRYTENLSGDYWKDRYLKSQWVISSSKNTIGDDGLYAYHGWELVQGGDPSRINPEVPPLGKYLIGLSVWLFHNNNIFGLFSGFLFLGAFFLLNLQVFNNKLLAFLPVMIFSFEPLFYEQLQASYLDTLHASFLFLTFLFFLRRKYLLSMTFLGFFTATKFSPLGLFVLAAILCYLLLQNKKTELYAFLPTLLLVPVVLLFSYSRYFLLGHSLIDFFKLQKYIFTFYSMGVKPPIFGMVFPMIVCNKWYTWWNGVQKVAEWSLLWPISLIGGVYSSRFLFRTSPFVLFTLWVVFYLIFLLLTPVAPRYLLLLLPFLYNLTIWVLSESTKLRSLFRFLA